MATKLKALNQLFFCSLFVCRRLNNTFFRRYDVKTNERLEKKSTKTANKNAAFYCSIISIFV